MDAISPARATRYPGHRTKTPTRFDFEVTGARLQVRAVDVLAERKRLLRESVRAVADEALSRLESEDRPGLDVDELRVFLEETALAAGTGNEPGRGTRGAVRGWSAKSRRNMLRTLAGLNDAGRWAMLTLTLPASWWELVPDPAALKRALRAFRMRWERDHGAVSAFWKLEFQRRGAPHYHLFVRVPADGAEDLGEWCARVWHEVLCHPGKGGRCVPATCEHLHHARWGVHLDVSYADRLRQAGRCIAAYFAKHGVWGSKAYQNVLPVDRWRQGMRLVAFMAGGPAPPTDVPAVAPLSERDAVALLFSIMAGKGPARPAGADVWASWEAFCAGWESPGRWWGMWNMDEAPTSHGELSEDEMICARLVARKVIARRTWRWVELGEPGLMRPVLLRRSMRSLHGDAGFWLLAANPSEFRWWFLATVRACVELPPGRERARFLSRVEEPGARPAPGRRRDHGSNVKAALTPNVRALPVG